MKKILFVDILMKEMDTKRDGQCYACTDNAVALLRSASFVKTEEAQKIIAEYWA